jgi:uncharacterized repeat protein (TIGR03803 family)
MFCAPSQREVWTRTDTVWRVQSGLFQITTAVLVSFNYTNGANPKGSLIADANGDLFGTTANGGANGAGTVFEIAKTATGYASTPTTLVSFNFTNGNLPLGGLIADANGNLFGTTVGGGANRGGVIRRRNHSLCWDGLSSLRATPANWFSTRFAVAALLLRRQSTSGGSGSE